MLAAPNPDATGPSPGIDHERLAAPNPDAKGPSPGIDHELGDGGVAALKAGLPSTLQELDPDFSECAQPGVRGVAALKAGLPSTLQS